MKKLYKYRPFSDFLFKELHYQELFFASYFELNDPLDLNAHIDFKTNDITAIKYLLVFILETQINFNISDNVNSIIAQINKISEYKKQQLGNKESLITVIYDKVLQVKSIDYLLINDIIKIISESIKETNSDFIFNPSLFREEIERLSNKFLRNSYITCFSETNDNFLMWSHYASKHSGICLEFDFNDSHSKFPYELKSERNINYEKYKINGVQWDLKSFTYWDKVQKVVYNQEQPYINFYNFSPVFANEYDCDLIGLSKSWTHRYAYELEKIFSVKTDEWKYEKEWRSIEINFGEPKIQENRIRHYAIEALSGIYFGVNTPENVKKRIFGIINRKMCQIKYYTAILTNSNKISFIEWEYEE